MRKGQASFEYMAVIGVALLILVALVSFSYKWAQMSKEDTARSIAQSSLNRITEAANLVYAQGPPARTRVLVEVPNNVNSITIRDTMISINLRGDTSNSDIHSTARARMAGNINASQGFFYVSLESMGDYVNVTSV